MRALQPTNHSTTVSKTTACLVVYQAGYIIIRVYNDYDGLYSDNKTGKRWYSPKGSRGIGTKIRKEPRGAIPGGDSGNITTVIWGK